MEITIQDEEERPLPPQEEQNVTENRECHAAAINTATEITENLVDSVLGTSATEASRIQSTYKAKCSRDSLFLHNYLTRAV
jgi:hypothetical protein